MIKLPVRYGLGMLMDVGNKLVCVLRPATTAETYPNMPEELGEHIALCINEHETLIERVAQLERDNAILKERCEGCPTCDPFWAERAEYESNLRDNEAAKKQVEDK